MKEITIQEFAKLKNQVYLLDVRSTEEFDFANIGGVNIPLFDLELKLDEVPKNTTIYCLCHHGVRSQHAALILASKGYETINIAGGIDAWSLSIDMSVQRY